MNVSFGRLETVRPRDTGDFINPCKSKRHLYVDGKPLAACCLDRNSVYRFKLILFKNV